jgi:hypothetical protein
MVVMMMIMMMIMMMMMLTHSLWLRSHSSSSCSRLYSGGSPAAHTNHGHVSSRSLRALQDLVRHTVTLTP